MIIWWLKYVESVYSIVVYIIFCNYVNLYINMFKRKKINEDFRWHFFV